EAGSPSGNRGSAAGGSQKNRRTDSRAAASPRWPASSSSTPTPAPSIAASVEPEEVPTMTSASRGSQASSRATRASAPTVQAPPTVPPQPRTRPRRLTGTPLSAFEIPLVSGFDGDVKSG